MWRGLSSLLPFLYVGYLFQLYNSYTLYKLSQHEECNEWQIVVLAFIFFILFCGNTFTTSVVVQQKLTEKILPQKKCEWSWAMRKRWIYPRLVFIIQNLNDIKLMQNWLFS
jgi:hypothetical protein